MGLLISFHTIACCISLVYLSRNYNGHRIYYDPALLHGEIVTVAALAPLAYLLRAPFSFGYFLGLPCPAAFRPVHPLRE